MDGLMEKLYSTLINMLAKRVDQYGRDWDTHLPYLNRAAVQESTQTSPFHLMYGREPIVPTETALSQPRPPYQIDCHYDQKSSEMKLQVDDCVMVHFPGVVCGKLWKKRPYFGSYKILSPTLTNAEVQLVDHPEAELHLTDWDCYKKWKKMCGLVMEE